ncbi:glycosyltransferase [Paenibacillus donghaensis]|uniref:glycosyltransferase n=1 Tax=Paenibacillus donghaensis TaxID=414771 RepID=UPI001884635F|nr:glycosyltransferase [Paenibacillus donghaensis]MBE9913438.1 glycosyltransferase [Paenibacillus donghaensis]
MDTVSVVIPAYNHEKFIGDAIESLFNQTYPHIDIIVVDDGSTDGTQKTLDRYRNRITAIRQSNSGVCAARNAGIRLARGRYICFLDSDDLFLPDKIERQLEVFHKNPKIGLVHTGANVMSKAMDGWNLWYTYTPPVFHSRDEQIKALLEANYIVCSTVMIRRDLFSLAGLFDTRYRHYGEDYDMWLRLLAWSDFSSVPEVMLHYRWHGGNQSRSADQEAISNIRQEAAARLVLATG